jgi:hypothetical protein
MPVLRSFGNMEIEPGERCADLSNVPPVTKANTLKN